MGLQLRPSLARPRGGKVQSYPLLKSLLIIASRNRLLVRGVELMRAAATEFFLPQYETRLFPGVRPVLTMAHPLDEQVPSRPGRLRLYLGYMGVFLKTLGFLYEACGAEAWRDMARMFSELCRLYYLSGSVYRRCQSTTRHRLPLRANLYSVLIRVFDPHLHCVPSLHILAVCYNYWAARRVLRRWLPADHPAQSGATELFEVAVHITETVLLVKQHSVLDIAPSLFLLSRTFPGYGRAEVERFVRALFRPPLAAELHEAVLQGYRELARLARLDPPATTPRSRGGGPDATDFVVEYLWHHAAAGAGGPSSSSRRPDGS